MPADSQPVVKTFGPLEYPKGHSKFGQLHPQRMFLENSADIVLYGGSRGPGKTWALIFDPLRYLNTAGFNGVIFRRDYGQIMMGGGPWETAESMWPWTGGKASGMDWYWPSGARIQFSHMHEDKDWRKWLGAQIPYMGFDQLETFEEKQFVSMLASNRDPNGVCRPCIRATANPEPGWLANFIAWYWDQNTGYPIMERSGKIRWFIRKGDAYKWADSSEALKSQYPGCFPKSFTFIAAFTDDNTVLMEKDPTYMGNLLAQDAVTQERWIRGNWKVKPAAGMIFNRAWWNPPGKPSQIIEVAQLPTALENFRWVRAWDIASTAAEEGSDPDWTAGVLMGMFAGQFYIRDVCRFRRSSKETEDAIRECAGMDGIATAIRMEEGANEKAIVSHYARNVLVGFDFQGVGTGGRNKVLRWAPLSSAVQAGNVFLIRGEWNSDFIDELDAAQGLDEKNDQCLVAGTMILCERGEVPIESVTVQDRVWTRTGWCRVQWSGKTGLASELVKISAGGRSLVSTPNHPVCIEGGEFVRLDAAAIAVKLVVWQKYQKTKRSGLTASSFAAIPIQHIEHIAVTSGPMLNTSGKGSAHCIRKFGSRFTGQSRTGMTFITKTGIHSTMLPIILSALQTPSITRNIGVGAIIQKTKRTLMQTDILRRRGMEAPKVGNGIVNTELRWLKNESLLILSVVSVGQPSKAKIQMQNFAPHCAEPEIIGGVQKTKSNASALSAVKNSSDSGLMRRLIAGKNSAAGSVRSKQCVPVYNLTVEGAHEFVANGFLVHNCDSAALSHTVLSADTGAWDAATLRGLAIGQPNEGVRALPHFTPRRLHS